MLCVEHVVDDARFAALRPEWDALLRAGGSRGIFLTWEWLHTWWRHLGQGRMLDIVALRHDGELVGLAPLALQQARLSRVPALEFLGSGTAGSDYLDLIAQPGFEEALLDAVVDRAACRRASLRLRRFDPARSLASRLVARLGADGFTQARVGTERCPFVRLAGHTWDSYIGSLGPQHRANLRRRLRHLERAGSLRFERVDSEAARREVLAALIVLHNRRFDERGGSEAFRTAADVAFHDDVSRLALERGWLRLYALRLDGRVAAALYGFLYEGRFSFYQSGFDTAEGRLSLGLVTMGLAIRAAIEDGALDYDLLHGEEPYKFLWCREARELAQLDLYPPTAAGRLAQRTERALRGARRAARRALPPRLVAALQSTRLWRAREYGAATAG